MLLVEIMTLVVGLVEKIYSEVNEKCQFGCSVPTCDGHPPPPSPIRISCVLGKEHVCLCGGVIIPENMRL